jgi:hypothetical protein
MRETRHQFMPEVVQGECWMQSFITISYVMSASVGTFALEECDGTGWIELSCEPDEDDEG